MCQEKEVKELRDNPGIFETTKVGEVISHGIVHGILPVIRGTGGTCPSRKSVYVYVIFATNKHIFYPAKA